MATYYLPSIDGWQSSGASTAYYLRLKVERSYDVGTNVSTYFVSLQAKGASGVYGGTYNVLADGTLSGGGNTLYTFVQPDANRAHKVAIDDSGVWRDVTSVYNPSSWSFSVAHALDGSSTVSFGVNLRLYGYISGTGRYGDFHSRTASLTVTETRASTIASCPSSVATNAALAISVNRASQAFYHIASFKVGAATLMTSAPFAASLSFTVPRSWFANYASLTSLSVTVSVQTYTDSGCSVAVGSPVTAALTVTADAGMVPVLAAGFAEVMPVGTPQGFSGYIQGVSRAQISLHTALVTHAAGASLASYTVSCQSYIGSGTGTAFLTNVLTGTEPIPVTVTVTDSRGRTAGTTLTVTPMAYAAPTLGAVSVFRCDENGAPDENGSACSARATAGCSSLNGDNSVSLSAELRMSGGSWGTAETLPSGTATLLGAVLDPDLSYELRLTATDALGSETSTVVALPTRQWAMKFRPDGKGVGFGMAPQHSRALELPSGWTFRIGDRTIREWTPLAAVTGTTAISMPSGWHEALVMCHYGEAESVFHLLRDFLTNNNSRSFREGWYGGASYWQVSTLLATPAEISLSENLINGVDCTSGTSLHVFYN